MTRHGGQVYRSARLHLTVPILHGHRVIFICRMKNSTTRFSFKITGICLIFVTVIQGIENNFEISFFLFSKDILLLSIIVIVIKLARVVKHLVHPLQSVVPRQRGSLYCFRTTTHLARLPRQLSGFFALIGCYSSGRARVHQPPTTTTEQTMSNGRNGSNNNNDNNNNEKNNSEPTSPISRVRRAANAARRTLRKPSGDSFTFDALIHRRLTRRDTHPSGASSSTAPNTNCNNNSNTDSSRQVDSQRVTTSGTGLPNLPSSSTSLSPLRRTRLRPPNPSATGSATVSSSQTQESASSPPLPPSKASTGQRQTFNSALSTASPPPHPPQSQSNHVKFSPVLATSISPNPSPSTSPLASPSPSSSLLDHANLADLSATSMSMSFENMTVHKPVGSSSSQPEQGSNNPHQNRQQNGNAQPKKVVPAVFSLPSSLKASNPPPSTGIPPTKPQLDAKAPPPPSSSDLHRLPPEPELPPSPPCPPPPRSSAQQRYGGHNSSRLQSRHRAETRETLLRFPEHDTATVSNLLTLFHGDLPKVFATLSQARKRMKLHRQQTDSDEDKDSKTAVEPQRAAGAGNSKQQAAEDTSEEESRSKRRTFSILASSSKEQPKTPALTIPTPISDPYTYTPPPPLSPLEPGQQFTERKRRSRSRQFSIDARPTSIWSQVSAKKSSQVTKTQPQTFGQNQSGAESQQAGSPQQQVGSPQQQVGSPPQVGSPIQVGSPPSQPQSPPPQMQSPPPQLQSQTYSTQTVTSPSVGKKRTRAVKEEQGANTGLNSFSLQAAQAQTDRWNRLETHDETVSRSTGGTTGSFSTDAERTAFGLGRDSSGADMATSVARRIDASSSSYSGSTHTGRGTSRPIQRYTVKREKHATRRRNEVQQNEIETNVENNNENAQPVGPSNVVYQTETTPVRREIFGSSSSTTPKNVWAKQGEHKSFTERQVNELLVRIQQLEGRLETHEGDTLKNRKDIRRRMDSAEHKMEAVDQMHEALNAELDENQLRVGKTEQYLDAMRRDLLFVVGNRRWRFVRYARAGVHNVLYYFLAYLVPVLAFFIRLIRDVVVRVRRRNFSIARSRGSSDSDDEEDEVRRDHRIET